MKNKIINSVLFIACVHVLIPVLVLKKVPDVIFYNSDRSKLSVAVAFGIVALYLFAMSIVLYISSGYYNLAMSVWFCSSSVLFWMRHKRVVKMVGPPNPEDSITGEKLYEGDRVKLRKNMLGTLSFEEDLGDGRWVVKDVVGGEPRMGIMPVDYVKKNRKTSLVKINEEEYAARALKLD